MTYTFKLARRLAVSRTLALTMFAACSGGDATAPDSSPAHPLTSGEQDDPRFRQTAPVTVNISPSKITVETNQLIQFLAHGTNSAGDSVGAFVEWTATGGTILPDGRFSAAATGTFMVVGRSPQGEQERIDTAVVEVVRRQVRLVSLEVAPGTTTLAPGLSQTFLVTGYLRDGRAVPVGSTWAATGGTIDAGGTYVAGDTAGTYQVIASHTVLAIADTASVTISAPAPPPPPPPAEPPATPPTAPPAPPELEKVTLMPASATLAPFATRQFVVFGRTAAGDSVALTPTFAATGGTVTDAGLYRAGSVAGTFRLIASSGSRSDTSTVVVTAPLGSGPSGSGIPLGLQGLMSNTGDPGPYTMSSDAYHAETILYLLNKARSRNLKVMMNMTGGSHERYKTNGAFDMAKWRAKMDTYNTPAIRAAVADAVADGTILGNSVMDEPGNTSTGSQGGDANSWGPSGTITKPRLDEMARYVKAIFPTLPVGYLGRHDWRQHETHRDLDFAVRQYSHRLPEGDAGNITRFRDEALAQGAKDGIVTVYSVNLLNGGIKSVGFNYAQYQADGSTWVCPSSTTGGRGLKPGNCRMHSSQVEKWGKLLGTAGVGLMMWRHDSAFLSQVGNQAALAALAAHLAPLPRFKWRP